MARISTSDSSRMANPSRANVMRGAAVGAVSALIMGLVWMIISAATGQGFFTPVMLIGATYFGVGFGGLPVWATLLGLLTHLVVGAAFGILFVAVARNITSPGIKLAAGLAYGAAVYLFMTFLVLPWANPIMYDAADKGLFFLLHLLYGAGLPLALPHTAREQVERRRHAVT